MFCLHRCRSFEEFTVAPTPGSQPSLRERESKDSRNENILSHYTCSWLLSAVWSPGEHGGAPGVRAGPGPWWAVFLPMGSVALLCVPCHPGSLYHTQVCFLLGDQVIPHNESRLPHSQVRRVSLLWVPRVLDPGLYFHVFLSPLCPESAVIEGCCNSRVWKSLYFIAC